MYPEVDGWHKAELYCTCRHETMKNDIVSRTGHLINLGRWKRIRYIGNQEEVEGGSSWSARSSHIVVEPLLPTRRLFKQKTCFEKAVVKGKMRCLPYKALKRLIRTGLLIMESRIFVILGIRKKSKVDRVGQQGVPTSWLSPYCQREDYSSRRPVLRLLLWRARWEMLAV